MLEIPCLLLASLMSVRLLLGIECDINYKLLISKVCHRQRSSSTELSSPSPNSNSYKSPSFFSPSIDSLDSADCQTENSDINLADVGGVIALGVPSDSMLYTDALTMRVPSLELMEIRRASLDSAMTSHDQSLMKKSIDLKLVVCDGV